jgi:hypothetical protein
MTSIIFFSVYLILPAAIGHEVYSFPNKNYYQDKENNASGSVVRVPGHRSRGPGSIPGANRFSEK